MYLESFHVMSAADSHPDNWQEMSIRYTEEAANVCVARWKKIDKREEIKAKYRIERRPIFTVYPGRAIAGKQA